MKTRAINSDLVKIKVGDTVNKIYFDTSKDIYALGLNTLTTSSIQMQFDNDSYLYFYRGGGSAYLQYYKNESYVSDILFYSCEPMRNTNNERAGFYYTEWFMEELSFDTPHTVLSIDSNFDAIDCVYIEEPKLPAPTPPDANITLLELVNKSIEINEYTEHLRQRLISSCNKLAEILYAVPQINLTIRKGAHLPANINGMIVNLLNSSTNENIFTHTIKKCGFSGANTDEYINGIIELQKEIDYTVPCVVSVSRGTNSNPSWDAQIYINGTLKSTITHNSNVSNAVINKGDSVEVVVTSAYCIAKGTKITLANGSYKNIEDIDYNDDILVWNFDEGKFDSSKPLWIKKKEESMLYNLLKFSDGSELKTISQHRIFNKQKGMFTYPMTDDTPVGTITFNEKGEEVTLISKEKVQEHVEYYNVITDYHINLFANGILTSCRYNNIYPIKDMKFIKDNNIISTYEDDRIDDMYIKGLRLAEQKFTKDENYEYTKNLMYSRK